MELGPTAEAVYASVGASPVPQQSLPWTPTDRSPQRTTRSLNAGVGRPGFVYPEGSSRAGLTPTAQSKRLTKATEGLDILDMGIDLPTEANQPTGGQNGACAPY